MRQQKKKKKNKTKTNSATAVRIEHSNAYLAPCVSPFPRDILIKPVRRAPDRPTDVAVEWIASAVNIENNNRIM